MTKNEIGPPWTVLKLLNWTQSFFEKRGISSPRFEAEILLAHVLKTERLQLYVKFDQPLVEKELATYRAFVKKRAAGEPIAYILGKKSFYNIELYTDSRALIPRADTEIVIEVALERMPSNANIAIDVGTGTGAIGLTLATELPNLKVIMTDISVDALDLAKSNVNKLGLSKRIGLLKGDLLDAVPSTKKFEAVISNPPYISEQTRKEVSEDVIKYEPHIALFAGEDGLDIIRRLTHQAFERLPEGGLFVTEIGFDQGASVPKLLSDVGFSEVEMREDYNTLPRVVSGIKK